MTAAPRRPTGPPPPPVVARVWVRYAKRGRMRFVSHRDFQRAFERALRRAHLPVGYSAGFTPHPKVSYVGAAPTGAASEAEYLEVGLTAPVDPAAVGAALGAALPEGLDVVEAVAAGVGSLADLVDASAWQVRLAVPLEVARAALDALVAASTLPVERVVKDGRRTVDVRAAVVAAGARADDSGDEGCAILDLVVRHVTPAVRPDDVLTGLRQVADLVPPVPPAVTRVAQGRLDASGGLADPLAAQRLVAGSGHG